MKPRLLAIFCSTLLLVVLFFSLSAPLAFPEGHADAFAFKYAPLLRCDETQLYFAAKEYFRTMENKTRIGLWYPSIILAFLLNLLTIWILVHHLKRSSPNQGKAETGQEN